MKKLVLLAIVLSACAMEVHAWTLSVIRPADRAIFQRNADGQAHVPVAVTTADGLADTVEVRAIDRQTKATVKDWAKVTEGITLTLPAGWYQLEFRAMKAGSVVTTATVERVGVGEVFVTCGQSNSANHGSPRQKAKDDRVSSCNFETGAWQHGDDPQPGAGGDGASPWALLGDLLVKQYDIPVGFICVGVGSTSVGNWAPKGACYPRLKQALQLAGPHGCRAVLWHQGESDSIGGTTSENYAKILGETIAQSRKDAGYAVTWGVALASFHPSPQATAERQAAVVEGQKKVIAVVPGVFQGAETDSFHTRGFLADTVHFNAQGLAVHAKGWADALAPLMTNFQRNADGQVPAPGTYDGKFCAGAGDMDFLRLIDESFAFFNPNPIVPNLTMVYKPEWDTLVEAGGWNAWWIQNSYGFSYAATPFLEEPWFTLLQRSWDLFWNLQGDGKRVGHPDFPLVAPDGCLGDCASPEGIVYKQGDGDWKNVHDWFHEATAAGVVMQAEILLTSRDRKALAHYLPKMARACDSIERTRDPKNNLFLVGPASNLLAPSYGGVRQPDGSFGPGYLAGLSVTYLAALDRMVELYKLAGDGEKRAEYERRQKITRESLPMLLAPAGYFVKSIEPGGVKHGVLGQKAFGYLEGSVNADAVALRVADDKTSESIYKQIAAFPEIRPFDFLLANAPGLDDTYWNWGNRTGGRLNGYHQFGDWVNGGAWSTVEGRAILMYYRLGKFEDIRRSATRAMKWSKDYRLDSPWSQRGANTDNWWYDEGKWLHGNGIKVTVDNYAIPAATIRGLFDYDYRSDRLIIRPRIPSGITRYVQKLPVRFGEKRLYLACRNGGPKVESVTVNGKKISVESPEEAVLLYDTLQSEAKVEITTVGGWPKEAASVAYAAIPALVPDSGRSVAAPVEWPESLKKPFAVLSALEKRIADEPGADYERAFVSVALSSFEDYRVRAAMEPGPGYFRPISRFGVREMADADVEPDLSAL